MTIKQYGGIFGRNPTFNNATIDGTLTVDQIVERTGAAGITLDGVTLKDGNVVLADGKGIDFSATSGTGTSELFDDYEEGAFTATLTPLTSGSITLSTSSNELTYSKIGRVVFVQGFLAVASVASPVGSVTNLNLPFASASLPKSGHRSVGNAAHFVGGVGWSPIMVFTGGTSAQVRLDASVIAGGNEFYFGFMYLTP